MPITSSNAKITVPLTALIKHPMEYYDDERLLSYKLFDYIYEGLVRGETCIVVSRPSLLIALQKMLRASEVNVAKLLGSGQYRAYDAEEVINGCVFGSQLDLAELKQTIERVVCWSGVPQGHTRVFGEVVESSHLRHNRSTAMEIEAMWAELHVRYGFSLLGAYKIIAEVSERDPNFLTRNAAA